MCWCTPEIRTPRCSRPECVPPRELIEPLTRPKLVTMVDHGNHNVTLGFDRTLSNNDLAAIRKLFTGTWPV